MHDREAESKKKDDNAENDWVTVVTRGRTPDLEEGTLLPELGAVNIVQYDDFFGHPEKWTARVLIQAVV